MGAGYQASKSSGTHNAAKAAEIELGGALDNHHFVAVDVMQRQFTHRCASNQDLDASFGELLENGFDLVLFALGEVEHFLGIVDQHGALGLGLSNVQRAAENSDLGSLGLVDVA